MSKAPEGWSLATLGQLGDYLNGRGFKKTEWRSSGRPIIRIQNLTGSSSEFNYFQGEALDQHVAHPGDLLVSWAATLGAYFWNGPEAVVNQHIFKVESRIDKRFHKYLLDSKLDELMSQTHGSGMVHITRSKFDQIPVWLPPRDEQERIVAILEEHLSDIDLAVTGVEACQGRLDALRSKTLQWALQQSAEDDECSALTIGDLADVGTGTTPLRSKKDFYDGGTIPWITSGDLSAGLVIEPKQYVTALALHETSLRVYPPGTLLVAMYGEGKTRGSVAELGTAATINQACAAIQLRNPEMLSWVRLVLAANYSAMRALASGGVQPNLNLSLVRGIPVPVPSEPTRRRLLGTQLALDDAAQRLRLELQEAASRARSLRRALLAAAFSGRLTSRGSDIDVIQEIAEGESE